MISLRKARQRGHSRLDWLDSYHSFSFGDYYDPRYEGFSALRVINEDRVAPGGGFASHRHRDMEILSYVIEGALEHKDSLGTGSIIRPGEVQRMRAGTGIVHSEYNASREQPVHFLQIWLLPTQRNLPPGYEQKAFAPEESRDRLRLVASADGREGSLTIDQDASVFLTRLHSGKRVSYQVRSGRNAYLHVVRGKLTLNGHPLADGDGAALREEPDVVLTSESHGEALFFDLP